MSFLDSVLHTIKEGGGRVITPPPAINPGEEYKASEASWRKRKAEDDLNQKIEKAMKTGTNSVSKPKDSSTSQQNGSAPKKPMPGLPPESSITPQTKAPKKGSFAEIMARAKQNAPEPGTIVGSIKHKPKEKSKPHKDMMQERLAAKKAAKKGVPYRGSELDKDKNSARRGDASKLENEKKPTEAAKSVYQGTMKQVEKPIYQGTAKASTKPVYSGTAKPSYQGSARQSMSAKPSTRPTLQPGKARPRYEQYSDNDSGNGYDEDSEDFSDMDAGFDDVEDEEEEAAKQARRDDAREQAELARLKREKDRKKALLSQSKRQ